MNDFLALMGDIVRAYATQHHSEMLDDPWETDAEWLNHVLGGWWIISPDMGWAWWLGVYTRCPVGQDLDRFPYCYLDAPLPNADLSEWLVCGHRSLTFLRTYEDWWDGDEEDVYQCNHCGEKIRRYIPR